MSAPPSSFIPPPSPLVEISSLDFAYASSLVLKQINLSLSPGTTLGITGPNGGGKTTLLRLLLGQLPPTRGTIRIADLPPRQAVRRGNLVGYLPQHRTAAPSLPINVKQAITLGLAGKTSLLNSYSPDDLSFVDHLLDRVDLADRAQEPLSSLSGGQLQRAFIARALAPRPQLLLLDEPTTGIDRLAQDRFLALLQTLKRDLNLTILFVTHDLPALSTVADRIISLNLTFQEMTSPQNA